MVSEQQLRAPVQDTIVLLNELQEGLLALISIALMLVSGLAWAAYLQVATFEPVFFLALTSLFIEAVLIYKVCRWNRVAARFILLIGPTASLLLASLRTGYEAAPYFAVLVVIANAVIDPVFGLYAAVLNTVLMIAIHPVGVSQIPPLLLLWLAAGIVWIGSRGLYTTLSWAWHSQKRASILLEELRDRRGELRRALTALTEATQRVERANRELAIARQEAEEARQIKAQFAANISHELRTPLNLIIGFSEMMVRSPEVYGKIHWTPALRADTREIHRSARHLLNLIDDILDLSRIEAQRLTLRLETTDLAELIQEAVSVALGLLRNKNVQLRVHLPDSMPRLVVDRTRIRQVLINLLHNAIRFTDQGYIEVSAIVGESEVGVAVVDTGVGIAEDDLQRIFEVFGQAKGDVVRTRGGTGLGLAICQQFVRLHGGRIEVESEKGKGSIFRFFLPLAEASFIASIPSYYAPKRWSPVDPERPLSRSVLVVGQDLRSVIPIARNIQGYRAVPKIGLDDLDAVVDAEHPAGIVYLGDPTEASPAKQIWEGSGRGDLPVIVLDLPHRTIASTLDVADYLVKPVQRDQLVEAIRRHWACPSRVLVVDDDSGFVALVARILRVEFEGISVLTAYSGEEALNSLSAQEVDLILLDLTLPGMSGFELVRTLHSEPRLCHVPLIILSASGYAEEGSPWGPNRIELVRHDALSPVLLGGYLRALLDVAQPDYTRASAVRSASSISC